MGSRHLVAAGEAGDGARFAALVAPTFAPVRVRPLVDGTFRSSVRSAAAGDVRVSVVGGSPWPETSWATSWISVRGLAPGAMPRPRWL